MGDIAVRQLEEFSSQLSTLEAEFSATECRSDDRSRLSAEFQRVLSGALASLHRGGAVYGAWVSDVSGKLDALRAIVVRAKGVQETYEREQLTVHDRVESAYARMRGQDTLREDVLALAAEYGSAAMRGTLLGLETVGDMVAHPVDHIVTPVAAFVADSAVLTADAYLQALERAKPGVKIKISEESVDHAKRAMKGRWEAVKATAVAFAEGSGPERVEMAAGILTVGMTTKQLMRMPGALARRAAPLFERVGETPGLIYDADLLTTRDVLSKLSTTATEREWSATLDRFTPSTAQIERIIGESTIVSRTELSASVEHIVYKHEGVLYQVYKKSGGPLEIAAEAQRFELMRSSLEYGTAPKLLGVSRGGFEWEMYTSNLPGRDMLDIFHGSSKAVLEQACHQLGLVLGELDTLEPALLGAEKKSRIARHLRHVYQHVSEEVHSKFGKDLKYSPQQLEGSIRAFMEEDVYCGLGHDDPHLANFLYDKKMRSVGVIDSGQVTSIRFSTGRESLPGYAMYMLQDEIRHITATRPDLTRSLMNHLDSAYEIKGVIAPNQHTFSRMLAELETMAGYLDDEIFVEGMTQADVAHLIRT